MDGDVIGGSVESGHAAHGVDQDLAMVRTGAPNQRAIDVEQNQSRGRRHLLLEW